MIGVFIVGVATGFIAPSHAVTLSGTSEIAKRYHLTNPIGIN